MLRARLAVLLMLVALVAACGSSGPSSEVTTSPTSAPGSPTTEPATDGSSAPDESQPVQSEVPTESASSEASTEPSTEPSADASTQPDGSTDPGAANGCTGSQDNRDFFASVALAVDWPVLCGALPQGWFISAGSYRLANGGKLTVSYKGPAGATLALSEGGFCTDAGGCVPPGVDVDDAAMGPLSGTFVALDDGGFAIVVDRGAAISWLLEAHGVDEATTRALAAALYEVAG